MSVDRVRHAKLYIDGKEVGAGEFSEIASEAMEAESRRQLGPYTCEFKTTIPMTSDLFEQWQQLLDTRRVEGATAQARIVGLMPPTDSDYRWARRRATRAQRRHAVHVLDVRRALWRYFRSRLATINLPWDGTITPERGWLKSGGRS